MGGALDQIKIIPVLRSGHEEKDMHALTNSHQTLNVDGCECAVQEDKDKMLSIIHTAFGSTHMFGKEVQKILEPVQTNGMVCG